MEESIINIKLLNDLAKVTTNLRLDWTTLFLDFSLPSCASKISLAISELSKIFYLEISLR